MLLKNISISTYFARIFLLCIFSLLGFDSVSTWWKL